ncbi:MAG: DMT family transporter [Candidatus Eisenbacteria bacterium]|nr:DMT family transporter [Candidatus Eisenbacteria bacterium]
MRGRKGAVVATLAAGLLWGSSFVVVKIGLSTLDPYWFVFLRFTTAALVALAVAALAGQLRQALRLLRHPLVVWMGVTNAVGFVLQFKGQTLTTAGKAALLVNTNTIFVAAASRLFLRERLGPAKALGIAAGMAGVFLVTTGGRLALGSSVTILGDLTVLAAAVVWTAFVLIDKRLMAAGGVSVRALASAMLIVTAATALPAALVFGSGRLPPVGWGLWPVGYTAVFCTVIPFALWTWGLKRISATTSSVILLTEVVFAMALAALVLGERQTTGALWGGVLIGAAVLLASLDSRDEIAAGPDIVPE